MATPPPTLHWRLLPPLRTAVLSCLLAAVSFACSQAPRPVTGGSAVLLERGQASWYGPKFHGRRTASGERYDMHAMTAAHRTLPFGTRLRVVAVETGQAVEVRINDRGPFKKRRIVDLSFAAAQALGILGPGTAEVELWRLPGLILVTDLVTGRPGELPAAYTVQVGAFAERERAQNLRDRLQAEGLAAEVVSGGPWHRVHIGHFTRREDAEKLHQELARMGWTALVVPAPSP